MIPISHSTVLVIIPKSMADTAQEAEAALDELLEPFNENEPVEPYRVEVSQSDIDRAVEYFREHPESCPGDNPDYGPVKPFDEFVGEGDLDALTEWTRQAVGAWEGNGRADGGYDAEKCEYFSYSRYNPKSRWDWWQLGGRWNGYFQIRTDVQIGGMPLPEWRKALNDRKASIAAMDEDRKEGSLDVATFDPDAHEAILGTSGTFGNPADENFLGRADLARKKHIDFAAMKAQAGLSAEQAYDKFEAATEGLPMAERWADVMKRVLFDHNIDPDHDPDPEVDLPEGLGAAMSKDEKQAWRDECIEYYRAVMNIARAEFHNQPWVKALSEANLNPFMADTHDYWHVFEGGRTSYVQAAIDGAVATFAVLKDGTWYERGKMGWFGFVGNEKEPDTWRQQFTQLIDSLDDDDWLAVVDVHI